MTLTPAALLDYLRRAAPLPTLAEAAADFGTSRQAVSWRLKALERAGLVTVKPRIARGIVITPRGARIPLDDVALAVDMATVRLKHGRQT